MGTLRSTVLTNRRQLGVGRVSVLLAATLVASIVAGPVVAFADGSDVDPPATEQPLNDGEAGTEASASDDSSTAETTVDQSFPGDQTASVASSNCPATTTSATVPAGFTKYSGRVFKNFNAAATFEGVKVTIFDPSSYDPTVSAFTKVMCRSSLADGAYELIVPNGWLSSSGLSVYLSPPEDAKFTVLGGQQIPFSPLVLPLNPSQAVQNFSLGGAGCEQGQGVAIPAGDSPFDLINISGFLATQSAGPKIVVLSNPNFGSRCAFSPMGGPYTVSVPRYWGYATVSAGIPFMGAGGVLLTAKALSGSEGATGGMVSFNGSSNNVTNQNFSFGPKDFKANIRVNNGNTSVVGISSSICVLTTGAPPEDKWVLPTRCTLGSPTMSASYQGGVIEGSITYTGIGTPSYWQYILDGPMGEVHSEWLPISGSAPHEVNQDVSIDYQPPSTGDGGDNGFDFDASCGANQTPTIMGVVSASAGVPYQTTVSLWATGESEITASTNPPRWISNFAWKTVTTSAQGVYRMCFDKSDLGSHTTAQIVAHSTQRGPSATLGDTGGETFQVASIPASESANTLNLAPIMMAAPTVKGTVTGSAYVRIVRYNSSTDEERDMAGVLADNDGSFAVSVPIASGSNLSYFLSAQAFGGDPPKAPYRLDFGGETLPVVVPAGASVTNPNVIAEIRDPNGNAIPNTYFDFTLSPVGCSSSCTTPGFVTFNNTKLVTNLPVGTWQVTARCWGCPYATTTGTITVTPGSPPVVSGSTLPNWQPGSGVNFTFRASTGAIKFRVMDVRPNPDVNYSASVSVRANLFRNGNISWANDQPVAQAGGFGWSPTAGQYQLSFIPSDPASDVAETQVYVESNGSTITKLCTIDNTGSRPSLSCSQNATAASDGHFEFAIEVANFTTQVCAPATGQNPCPPVVHPTNSWAKAMLEVDQIIVSGNSMSQSRLTSVEVSGTTAKLRINPGSGGIYRLKFSPPWGNPYLWASVEDVVYVAPNGTWYDCLNDSNPFECANENGRVAFSPISNGVGYNATTGVLSYPKVQFEVAPIVGTVRDPNSQVVNNTWVEIQKLVTDSGCQCSYYQWIGGAPTNAQGRFGFSVGAGKYRVRANPPWSNPNGFADGSAEFEVLSDKTIKAEPTNSAIVEVSGKRELSVSLRNPNVIGVVKAGAEIREFAGVSVEKWVSVSAEYGEWRWQPLWGNSDETGTFRMFLDNGIWRLTAWPRGSDAGQFVEGRVEVTIAGGVMTKLGADTCGAEVSCSSFDLSYGIPNVSGIVRNASDSPVPYVGVGIEKWSATLDRYEWTNWSNGTNDGGYSVNLGDGLYRFGFNPPRSDTSVVRTNRFVIVDGPSECIFTVESQAKASLSAIAGPGDACVGASTNLDVTMAAPNVNGKVANSSGAGQTAWVRAEVWNGQYFEWQDKWAEANTSGEFSFDLASSSSVFGSYAIHRLTAEPRSGSGLSQGVVYIRVSSSGWTYWCVDASGVPGVGCPAGGGPDGGGIPMVAISLPGANLIAEARFSGDVVSRGWVEVFKVDGESLMWKTSTGLDNSGRFSLRLIADGSDDWTQYRVLVNPDPWSNPNNLSKKRIDLWIGDSNDNGTVKDEICLSGAGFVAGVSTSACSSWVTTSATSPYVVAMSNGNVQGYVVRPGCSQGCGVNQAELSVEKWVTTSATSGYWRWTDNWARTSSNGGYALQIDEAGDYRLTARPPWGTSDLSASSIEFTWAPASVSASNYTMYQNLALSLPNVSVIVNDGAQSPQPVANAWVSVEKKVTNGQWSWWEWTGLGTGTTSNGSASLNIVNTTGTNEEYRLVVYPPWNNTANLTRFSRLIKVKPDQTVTTWDGTGALSGSMGEGTLSTLSFPGANLVLTVNDGSQPVANAWVHIEKWVTTSASSGYWEWSDIAGGTSGTGKVALTVTTDGWYRVVVSPPWNRQSLPRFTREFVKTGSSFDWDLNTSGSQVLSGALSFPSANFTGTVFAKSSPEVRNSHAWIDVRTENGLIHIAGTNTNASGNFSMSLPAGTYSVWFLGNPSLTAATPTKVIVTVSATAIESWQYQAGDGGCGEANPCTLNPVLERTNPNLNLLVTMAGSPRRGAFVRLTDEAGAKFDFVTNASGLVKTYLPSGTYSANVLFAADDGVIVTGSATLLPENFQSDYSGSVPTATIAVVGRPTAPTGVIVNPGSSGSLSVSWSASTARGSAISGYVAQVSTDSSKSCATNSPSVLTCDITGLTAGTYSIVVRATSDVGNSPASTPVSGTATQ